MLWTVLFIADRFIRYTIDHEIIPYSNQVSTFTHKKNINSIDNNKHAL